MNNKVRIAFVKFAGLASGGTEKFLQTIAANLPKEKFNIDYFYSNAAPYIGSDYRHGDNDESRKQYMLNKGVNLIEFKVGHKNVTVPTHDWLETNFWDVFKESDYDLVITARAGHKEYPFCLFETVPLIDILTLPGMADQNKQTKKVIHISEYQKNTWINAGGLESKTAVIPIFQELPEEWFNAEDMRNTLGLENKFIYGMHQRPDPGIFSPIPLLAYSKIENEDTAFLLMGGDSQYSKQAIELKLKDFYQLDPSGDQMKVASFLKTLNVYAHGRRDGETGGLAISEAMSFGLPVISHEAPAMGHVETIGTGGVVVRDLDSYITEMKKLQNDHLYYQRRKNNAEYRYNSVLSLDANMQNLNKIIDEVLNKVEEERNFSWDSMWQNSKDEEVNLEDKYKNIDLGDFNSIVKNYENTAECHLHIWSEFTKLTNSIPELKAHRDYIDDARKHGLNLGHGDRAFQYFWNLIVDQLPDNFNFLEIGVYKGQIISLVKLLSNIKNKNGKITGVTPLYDPDFASYNRLPYINAIFEKFNLSQENVEVIDGYSTDEPIKQAIRDKAPYDLVYVDGDHSYEGAYSDIMLTKELVKVGGLLAIDDTSNLLNMPKECFHGIIEVAEATRDSIEKDNRYIHLFACGHIRLFKRVI